MCESTGESVKVSDSQPHSPHEIQKQQVWGWGWHLLALLVQEVIDSLPSEESSTNDERRGLRGSPAYWAFVSWYQLGGKALPHNASCLVASKVKWAQRGGLLSWRVPPPPATLIYMCRHTVHLLSNFQPPGSSSPPPWAEDLGLQHWKVKTWHLLQSARC